MLEQNFIGNRIYDLRKKLNMSMQEFAELLGSSAGYISDLEKGKSTPSISLLISICDALHISLNDFFSSISKPEPLTPELHNLLDSARTLTPDQIRKLTSFIESLK